MQPFLLQKEFTLNLINILYSILQFKSWGVIDLQLKDAKGVVKKTGNDENRGKDVDPDRNLVKREGIAQDLDPESEIPDAADHDRRSLLINVRTMCRVNKPGTASVKN